MRRVLSHYSHCPWLLKISLNPTANKYVRSFRFMTQTYHSRHHLSRGVTKSILTKSLGLNSHYMLRATKGSHPALAQATLVATLGQSSSNLRLLEVSCCWGSRIASGWWCDAGVLSSASTSCRGACWSRNSLTWGWGNVGESWLAGGRTTCSSSLLLWGRGAALGRGAVGLAPTTAAPTRVISSRATRLIVVVVWRTIVVAAWTCRPVSSWWILGGTWSTGPNIIISATCWSGILLWGRGLSS